jgi:hypothetical protein
VLAPQVRSGMVPTPTMGSEIAEATRAALALLESSLTRLAEASLQLSRSRAWQDVLATVDHLAALLGAQADPRPEPVPVDADPAGIARFVTGRVESLLLPEYLESSSPREARYRVRLPEEARADGLGDLVDFLDALALRLDLAVDAGTARLAIMVGGGERPALAAACAAERLQVEVDLGATRDAWRHVVALAGRVPVARQLEVEELFGVLRASFAVAGDGRPSLTAAIIEPVRILGRTGEGPLRIEIRDGELVSVEGDIGGTLRARVGVGAAEVVLPAAVVNDGTSGLAEYRLAGVGGELQVRHGDRALTLRRLGVGGEAGLALRDGRVVGRVQLVGPGEGVDLVPGEPGRFVLAPEGELTLIFGSPGQEVTVSVPSGTRLEMARGRLEVQKGRLVLDSPAATAPLEIGEGNALVRRTEPRSGERHPILRLYTSTPASGTKNVY